MLTGSAALAKPAGKDPSKAESTVKARPTNAPAKVAPPAKSDAPAELKLEATQCLDNTEIEGKDKKSALTCFPQQDFVARLCAQPVPNATVHLFHQTAPWTHAFLKNKTATWSTEAKRQDNSVQWLEKNEEVVLVGQKDGGQAGGSISFMALRWDGSCVFLTAPDITTTKPLRTKHSPLDGTKLDAEIKELIRKDGAVTAAYQFQRSECFGMLPAERDKKCLAASEKLSSAIAGYTSKGGALPPLRPLPALKRAGGKPEREPSFRMRQVLARRP